LKIIYLFEITEKMDNTSPIKNADFAPLLSKVDFSKVDKVDQYIAQLDDIQRKAMEIAKSHLGTSFNIKRSNGFIEWQKKNAS
jgi:hypothetical protein